MINRTELGDGSILYTFGDTPPTAQHAAEHVEQAHQQHDTALPDEATLRSMTVAELRALAKTRNAKAAKLRKEELIGLLLGNEELEGSQG